MKKLTFFLLVSFVIQLQNKADAQSGSFSYTNVTGSNSITCSIPFIHLLFSSTYTTAPVTYFINSASSSFSGTAISYSLTSPGVYSIVAQAPGSFSYSQVVTIGINTTIPTSTISPISQFITCTNSAVQTVTGIATPTLNITQKFNWGQGGHLIVNSFTALATPPPGTHTYIVVDNLNGCSTSKTFTVATGPGFPTYSVTSPIQNFSMGCVPKNICDITILNPNTTPAPGGSLSFTLLSSSSSTNFGFNSVTNFSIVSPQSPPGTYTLVAKDDVTNCQTRVPVSITQNTLAPQPFVSVATTTLTCFTPSVLLFGVSQPPNSTYQWSTTAGVIVGNTVLVNVTANPTTTFLSAYQFIVTDNNNACKNLVFVPLYQNIFKPNAIIQAIPGVTLASITCLTPSITLVNQSTTGIPLNSAFPTGGIIIARLWEGPSPQLPQMNTSNVAAFQPGTYSLTVEDMNNGCKSSTVFTVGDNRVYPDINSPGVFTVSCPGSATVFANVTSAAFPCRYEWLGSLGLIKTATLTNFPEVATATVGSAGVYTLVVTDLVNACVSTHTVVIYGCVGMDENNNHAAKITIYPNPAGELLYLDLPKKHQELFVKIYNAQGALVIEQTLGQAENALRLEKIAKGLYSIQVFENTRLLYYSRLIKD